jgi:hypothetical protein
MNKQQNSHGAGWPTWLVLGNIVATVVVSMCISAFSELGKTEDWVLEYRTWIRVGFYVVYFAIVIAFVLFGPGKMQKKSEPGS